jgi:hypothetical protein
MGGECGTHAEIRNSYKNCDGKPEWENHLEDPVVDVATILKQAL